MVHCCIMQFYVLLIVYLYLSPKRQFSDPRSGQQARTDRHLARRYRTGPLGAKSLTVTRWRRGMSKAPPEKGGVCPAGFRGGSPAKTLHSPIVIIVCQCRKPHASPAETSHFPYPPRSLGVLLLLALSDHVVHQLDDLPGSAFREMGRRYCVLSHV